MLTMTTEPKRPAIEGEEHGPFRSVPFVARRIRWTERTVRRHIVPVTAWLAEMKRHGRTIAEHVAWSGDVPSLRLGAMHRIPLWWLEAVLAAAKPPGEPANSDD